MIPERKAFYKVVQNQICNTLVNHNFLINDINAIKFSFVRMRQLTKKITTV